MVALPVTMRELPPSTWNPLPSTRRLPAVTLEPPLSDTPVVVVNAPLTARLPVNTLLVVTVSEAAEPDPEMIWALDPLDRAILSETVTALPAPADAVGTLPVVVSLQLPALLQTPPLTFVHE